MSETFSSKRETIEKRLALTDEMRVILMFEASFPSSGYIDTADFLKTLEIESAYLSQDSIARLRESEELMHGILSFFKSDKGGKYPHLQEMSGNIVSFPEIRRRIDMILDKYGEIKDNASPELFTIRKSIREKEISASKRINSLLKRAQEEGISEEGATVSIRDGKALIPVSAANKKKLPGFVYDESSSGKTVFIEPVEVIEINNQIRELKFEEQREIVRILVEFSDFLRPYLPELLEAAKFMGELDFICAKASLASSMEAGKPVISTNNEMRLIRARHPLLESSLKKENKQIVPLSFELNEKKRILLISGPNAGGKSVCLKTTGLLQYMLQTGLLIPASESSEIRLFKSVFIDIGDEQSIENDLSTYSSHLLNMKTMLSDADGDSLVLIDEFGSGTEPTAGGAIAEAILEEIEKRGCFGVITTHYSNLKFYASNSSGVVNGAMMFDAKNIQPLFKLEIGLPGNSFAFELARKIGFPEDIVKRAEEKAGNDFVDIERHLKKIARSRRDLDRRLERIRIADKTLESVTGKYQKELEGIRTARKEILEKAREEAEEMLSGVNRKIESTIREIRESQAEKEKTKEIRNSFENFRKGISTIQESDEEAKLARKLDKLIERQKRKEDRKREKEAESAEKDTAKTETVDNSPAKPGDHVRIKESGLAGEVISADTKKLVVSVGNIKMSVSPDKIEKISNNEYARQLRQDRNSSPVKYNDYGMSERRLNFKSSIDIRGYRLNEAIDTVSKLVDDAVMFDISQVKILHGKGNGILKEEIRKYLKNYPGVKSCRDEAVDMGGSGITIVELE